jgi:hypothetical protein
LSDHIPEHGEGGLFPGEHAAIIPDAAQLAEKEKAERQRSGENHRQLLVNLQTRQTDAQVLQAQANRTIARLTAALLVVSLMGGFVSILQFQATKRSADAALRAVQLTEDSRDESDIYNGELLIRMKDQSRAMHRSADASVNAAVTANDTLKNSRSAFRQEQRAYLSATAFVMSSPAVVTDKSGRHVCGDVHAANSGRTPAFNIEIFRHATYGQDAESTVKGLAIPKNTPNGDVLGTVGDKYGTACTPVVDSPTEQSLTNGSLPLYIYGAIEYDDIFGDHHETGFCSERVLKQYGFHTLYG